METSKKVIMCDNCHRYFGEDLTEKEPLLSWNRKPGTLMPYGARATYDLCTDCAVITVNEALLKLASEGRVKVHLAAVLFPAIEEPVEDICTCSKGDFDERGFCSCSY